MKMAYKSVYRPKNKKKYIGKNINNIITRSTWEKGLCKWLDRNTSVKSWSLESVIIPYFDQLYLKHRRYFMDFYIEMNTGQKLLVEVKPYNQTVPPKNYNKKYKEIQRLLTENSNIILNSSVKKKYNSIITFAKNKDKWNTARLYAKNNGFVFHIWTEYTLKKLGIKIITRTKPLKRIKRRSKKL